MFLVSFVVKAQNKIYFSVSDIVTNEYLPHINVSLKSNQYATATNANGLFYLPGDLLGTNDSDGFHGLMFGQGGHLRWHFNTSFAYSVFSTGGQLVYKAQKVDKEGDVSLQQLADGIYYLRLRSDLGNRTYTLVAQAGNLIVSSHQSKNYTVSNIVADTLILSGDNFFELKIPLNLKSVNPDEVRKIKMLRKSYPKLNYFTQLLSKNAFNMISATPPKTHLSEVESTKILIDRRQEVSYYFNVHNFKTHYIFAVQQLGYQYSQSVFINQQYRNNPERYLYPITLNYFKDLDVYTFEFFSGDEASCDDIKWCYDKIRSTTFIGNKLRFYSTNDSWNNCHSVPTITSNELYEGQNYQALNLTENYGYLQKLELKDIAGADLQRHDILLTNSIPVDISVIAGIITTEFQTPLSHANVLSHNRGTPNMALRDGFSNEKLLPLIGKLVYLKVLNDSFIIRSATIDEASAFWAMKEPYATVVLKKDTFNYGLMDLNLMTIDDVDKVGGKAANFAELLNAFQSKGLQAPVPEGYFAIPFYYYNEHLKKYGIGEYITRLISSSDFKTSSLHRKEVLQLICDTIIHSPLDAQLLEMVENKLKAYPAFTSFRFRSSTNAEDLEGFNGAGLYSSFSGKTYEHDETIELAIKKVWASLWNFTAFEEREYFKIVHSSCAMGVLVHRSFPTEDANGVVITRNPYNGNHAYVVNVQFGNESIVAPQPGVIHDQVVIYMFSLGGHEPYSIEYNSFSNLYPYVSEHVMKKSELFTLADYLSIIKHYFYQNVYPCNCDYYQFGLDVEFKVDSDTAPRKIYIKQVRPY